MMNVTKTDTPTMKAAALSWLTALLLAAALNGCTADAPETDDRSSPNPITFGAAYRPDTRAAPGTLTLDGAGTGEKSLRTTGFGVFACHTGLHPYVSSSVMSNYMWNQQVTYDDASTLWDYTPLRYWPSTVEGLNPYISFAAYAPYAAHPGTGTTAAERCIVDIIRTEEGGDPWLVYQLGGSENDWQAHQVDLLYDFRRDQQQGDVGHRVSFLLRHALASAGDEVSVGCSMALQRQLKAAYSGTPLSITLERVTLVYTLLRKGRLWLTDDDTPRWETIASETPTVLRRLVIEPPAGQVIATATSASECTVSDYTLTNQGIFYIPINVAGCEQHVDISVSFHLSTDPTVTRTHTATVDLTDVTKASSNRSFHIVLSQLSSL